MATNIGLHNAITTAIVVLQNDRKISLTAIVGYIAAAPFSVTASVVLHNRSTTASVGLRNGITAEFDNLPNGSTIFTDSKCCAA